MRCFSEATKDGNTTVADEVSLKLIAKLVKQRKDSAAIYIEQNRPDLAVDEVNQLAYLEPYLPAHMGEEEVRKVVQDVIAKVGASSPTEMGKCMGLLMGRLNGKADGSLISKIVKEELS